MTDERDDEAAAPLGSPFPWGLTPGGGDAPEQPQPPAPAAPVPPAVAQPPVIPPPAALPPAPVTPPTESLPASPTTPPPPAHDPAPTQAFTAFPTPEPAPTEAFASLDPALEGVTEALAPQPVGLPDPVDESLEASPLDSLFGEAAFVEYEAAPILPPPPRRQASSAEPGQELVAMPRAPKPPRAPIPRVQKILMAVAGGLVAVLALIALFLLGTRLSNLFPPPAVVASASPSPSPSATGGPLAIGPVAPGLSRWDRLLGGECLDPFESAWQDEYTVVPCAQPHAAQLVHRGTFDDPAVTAFPGTEELLKRVAALCTAPTIIDYAVAGTVLDLQVSASFAVDDADWDDGNREYFCFVDRSGGEPLSASLVVPPATQ